MVVLVMKINTAIRLAIKNIRSLELAIDKSDNNPYKASMLLDELLKEKDALAILLYLKFSRR